MKEKPYLSIVATTRNDNHGGDLLARTTCFVKGIYYQARKYNLPVELIMVEWNPPADKPLLKEVLPKPAAGEPVILRYVIVPNEIHQTFRFRKEIPLYQMIAKNVGIVRAKGEFILCTNIDLLFSDECFAKLAKRDLKKGIFYRANRCDIPKDVMNIEEVGEQLKYCNNNIMSRLGRPATFRNVHWMPRIFYRFPTAMKLLDKLFEIPHVFRKKVRDTLMFSLDFDACVDFTLMAKSDWYRIHGYVELDMYSLHIDSMALISCMAVGIEQKIFSKEICSYHIYHDDGWASNYENVDALIRFLVRRPALDWFTVMEAGKKHIRENTPFALNPENWGYSDKELPEYTFSSPNVATIVEGRK